MSEAPTADIPHDQSKKPDRIDRSNNKGKGKPNNGKGGGKEYPKRKPSAQEEALQKKIEALNTEYDRLREEKGEISKVIRVKADAMQAIERGTTATQGKLGALTKRILRAEEDVKKSEHELEQAKKYRDDQFNEVQKLKAKLDFKVTNDSEQNMKIIDAKIKELEDRLVTQSFSLKEEKEVLAKITKWKNSKVAVKEYEQRVQQVRKGTSTTGLQNKVQRNKDFVATLKKQYEEELEKAKSDNTKLTAENDIPALEKKSKEIDEAINKCLGDIRQANADREQAKKEAIAAEKAKVDAIYAAKRERYQRMQEERAAREDERKRQELEIPPLANELADAFELLVYLNGLVGGKVADDSVLSSGKKIVKPTNIRKVEAPTDSPKGSFLPSKKKDDDIFEFVPVQKKGQKAKAQKPAADPTPKKAKDDVIKHSVATLQHFAKLDLAPPLKLVDVAEAIKTLEAKRAELQKKSDELQAQRIKDMAERDAKAKAAAEPSAEAPAVVAESSAEAPAAPTETVVAAE